MTWEDDMYREQERLKNIETQWIEGTRLVEDNLRSIEKALSQIDKDRAAIGETAYFQQREELLRLRQENYRQKQIYAASKRSLEEARQNIQRAWIKNEELRNKGIRG